MKKILFIIGVFLFLQEGSVISAQSTTFTGYIRDYTGILLKDDNDIAIMQDTLDLRIEHSRGKVAFKANPYIHSYPNKDQEIGLRQAFMDIYLDSVDIRIGKQQIVWGKADGVFITDVVSPKDMSDFLLPDFEEIRLGIQVLKMDYYLGDNTAELVWVSSFTPTTTPDADSIWYIEPSFAVTPTYDYTKKEVSSNLANSEVFFKFSAVTSMVDFEIMTGYMWDDEPTMHIKKSIDPTTNNLLLTGTPEYHRLKLGGGSFSTTLGGFVVRGEAAYYNGKYFSSADTMLVDGVVEKDYIHYMLGMNYSIWDVKTSLQFIQQKIQDYDENIVSDENEDTVTLLLARDFLRETLHFELFSYFDLNDSGSLIRPKVSYDLIDGFKVLVGLNVFNGEKGKFGQYDDNDMVYSKIKYSF